MKDLIFELNKNNCRLINKQNDLYTIVYEKNKEEVELTKAHPFTYFLNKTFKQLIGGE
jgi:hypothetical protein